ncbi:hypothetical protein RJT34_12597 [Clitoria ternatea]|uniref:Uncharacterized protein n=1 Tax=Clitoria ternatea TaxID=43366 RepID=A0AAN9JM04_CLITE
MTSEDSRQEGGGLVRNSGGGFDEEDDASKGGRLRLVLLAVTPFGMFLFDDELKRVKKMGYDDDELKLLIIPMLVSEIKLVVI